LYSIIFVHGLTGGRERSRTAKKAEKSWPEVLLPLEIPNARVLTFGYDANVTNTQTFTGVVSKNGIQQHAWNLLNAIDGVRTADDNVGVPSSKFWIEQHR